MKAVFLCEGVRTPIGRYGGALASMRPDDMAALVIDAVLAGAQGLDPASVDDVVLGCANQAGEDNRNVARMAVLLSRLPESVPGTTINRLCGSGLDAVASAARAVAAGEAEVMIAGGVESMSRAPFVMPKGEAAFAREAAIYDTTIGWRFVNPRIARAFGTDAMPETAENLAAEYGIAREDQDAFALRSQARALAAQASGRLGREIVPVEVPRLKGDPRVVARDEHPRETSLEALAKLRAPFREGGTVTAGNASGINDGAAALIVASENAVARHGLVPKARILGAAMAGVPPRVMGIGPVPATERLLGRLGLTLAEFDRIELNEAFAAQAIAVLRAFGLPEDADWINPHGGAIALGHPLGMSGARLALTAAVDVADGAARRALCTLCIGVGQGIALAMERA